MDKIKITAKAKKEMTQKRAANKAHQKEQKDAGLCTIEEAATELANLAIPIWTALIKQAVIDGYISLKNTKDDKKSHTEIWEYVHSVAKKDVNDWLDKAKFKSSARLGSYDKKEAKHGIHAIDARIDKILYTIYDVFNYQLQNIPRGGHKKIKNYLLDHQPRLFTEATFDSAWKKANKIGVISVQDKQKFTPKKVK